MKMQYTYYFFYRYKLNDKDCFTEEEYVNLWNDFFKPKTRATFKDILAAGGTKAYFYIEYGNDWFPTMLFKKEVEEFQTGSDSDDDYWTYTLTLNQ